MKTATHSNDAEQSGVGYAEDLRRVLFTVFHSGLLRGSGRQQTNQISV